MKGKEKNFARTLPEGYGEVFHIDARNKKVGILLNLIAVGIATAVVALAFIPVAVWGLPAAEIGFWEVELTILGWVVGMLAYMVLHELTHGVAYKALTGEKLTFGMSWSCAFCGVPNVYTYRRTALVALVAPLCVFSVLLLGLIAVAFFVHPLFYWMATALFAMHLGGCCGDGYMTWLLLFKYRNPALLMRDTGPEQWLYLPESPEHI